MATETMMSEFFSAELPDVTNDTPAIENNETAPENTTVVEVPQKKYTREIDLEDGSGKQVFTADSVDELLDKLADAQKHATRKIRDQEKRLKVLPERAEEPQRVSAKGPLTADQRRDLAEKFMLDPVAAMDEYMAGNPKFQAFEDFTIKQQAMIEQNAAEQTFLTSVGDQFHPSPRNAEVMINYLKSESLPYTARNLEYAFQELSASGLLETKPNATDETTQGEDGSQRIVVNQHTRTKPMSTGTRSSKVASQRTEENPNTEVESNVQQILAEPDLEKSRQKMLALMAKQRKAASVN